MLLMTGHRSQDTQRPFPTRVQARHVTSNPWISSPEANCPCNTLFAVSLSMDGKRDSKLVSWISSNDIEAFVSSRFKCFTSESQRPQRPSKKNVSCVVLSRTAILGSQMLLRGEMLRRRGVKTQQYEVGESIIFPQRMLGFALPDNWKTLWASEVNRYANWALP